MQLFSRVIGEGEPVVILHGVFGSGDNLFTASKLIVDAGYKVYLLDARNHGKSPHDPAHNYKVMAQDLDDFLNSEKLVKPVIIGHSMGGKTVMQYSQSFDNYSKLVIIDIAPRAYTPHHEHILAALKSVDLKNLGSRKDAESILNQYISDFGEQQFILKNLYRTDDGGFGWRINVDAISHNIEEIGKEIELTKNVTKPTLFIKGELSNYVSPEDEKVMRNHFSKEYIIEIKGANHWVHATKPVEFVQTILSFLKS